MTAGSAGPGARGRPVTMIEAGTPVAAGARAPPHRVVVGGRSGSGIALLLLLGGLALAAPLITHWDPTFESPAGLGPGGVPLPAGSPDHLLGTDPKGRDLAARVLYGGRVTLVVALAGVAIATVAGLLVGLAAAGSGGIAAGVLMRSTDLGLAIPGLLLVAAIATILGRGEVSLTLGLAAVFWAPIARVTYGQAAVLRERRFVEAATVQGARARLGPHPPRAAAPGAGGRGVCRAVGRLGGPVRGLAGVPGRGHPGADRRRSVACWATPAPTTAPTRA